MAQEIEIEFKTLLTKNMFLRIKKSLPFPREPINQTNYYFETKDFSLKKASCALRIREKNNAYVLTLKEPHSDGILETHDSLTRDEFSNWIDGNPMPKEHTMEQLNKKHIAVSKLIYFGSLRTERLSFTKNGIEYVLDKSFYFDTVDYELEIEAPTYEIGLASFENLLHSFQLEKQKSITKIERFFREFNHYPNL